MLYGHASRRLYGHASRRDNDDVLQQALHFEVVKRRRCGGTEDDAENANGRTY